jgi:valyl-tRNA synthetase
MEVAKAAIHHAERQPGRTLGIVAMHQSTCIEIESAIGALTPKDSPAARFFQASNPSISFYVKTPERAVNRPRDTIFVCAEYDPAEKKSINAKLSNEGFLAKAPQKVIDEQKESLRKFSEKAELLRESIEKLG